MSESYVAIPAAGRGPGVLVLHGARGLVPHVRDVCDRLAREGFVALAPDLFGARERDDAGRLMRRFDLAGATADLDAAATMLLSHDAVMGAKLGSVGFGMGGPLALLAATSNRRIRAVVDFYGRHAELTEPMLHLAGLEAAVLGLFGERDACLPPQAVKQFETSLREAGKRAAIRVYPGVGHAFFDATRPDVYDAAAAAAAWRETVAFLRSELA